MQIAVDPSGQYLYYLLMAYELRTPVVQYNVKTGERKALCWLQEYYFDKYGYWMDFCYGMEISIDGSFLVLCMNGTFGGREVYYGHPSLLVIDIPEEERPLN